MFAVDWVGWCPVPDGPCTNSGSVAVVAPCGSGAASGSAALATPDAPCTNLGAGARGCGGGGVATVVTTAGGGAVKMTGGVVVIVVVAASALCATCIGGAAIGCAACVLGLDAALAMGAAVVVRVA